jgi:hypothetical protein
MIFKARKRRWAATIPASPKGERKDAAQLYERDMSSRSERTAGDESGKMTRTRSSADRKKLSIIRGRCGYPTATASRRRVVKDNRPLMYQSKTRTRRRKMADGDVMARGPVVKKHPDFSITATRGQ